MKPPLEPTTGRPADLKTGRRQFVQASMCTLLSACSRRPQTALQPFTPLTGLADAIQSRSAQATALLNFYLERIRILDASGPTLRSIVELNPEARSLAATLDKAQERDVAHRPLQGLPILLKDNIDTADGMKTTAGSLALVGAPKPKRDATVAQRLREAGMLILGKTNLSEWANIRSPNSTSGWSARGGLTVNPHRLTHSASGSSSGSAAAVAAGLAPAAIGTETNGSIVSPASDCGIVGLKPTVGLISRAGIIPITHHQDTAGPMTLTVRDAALLLNALAGADERDPQTLTPEAAAHRGTDYTALLQPHALKGVRLGILRSQCGNHSGVLQVFQVALAALRATGAVLVEVPELPNEDVIGRLSMQAMLTELRTDLNLYLANRGGEILSLADVIAFNKAHPEAELVHFGQEFFERAEARGTPEAQASAQEARLAAQRLAGPEGLDVVLTQYQLDALICPTNDPADKIDLAKGDPNSRCACTPAAVAGYPHLTVPMGLVAGLPVGLSFMGAAWTEAKLLAFGHAFETAMPARADPTFAL